MRETLLLLLCAVALPAWGQSCTSTVRTKGAALLPMSASEPLTDVFSRLYGTSLNGDVSYVTMSSASSSDSCPYLSIFGESSSTQVGCVCSDCTTGAPFHPSVSPSHVHVPYSERDLSAGVTRNVRVKWYQQALEVSDALLGVAYNDNVVFSQIVGLPLSAASSKRRQNTTTVPPAANSTTTAMATLLNTTNFVATTTMTTGPANSTAAASPTPSPSVSPTASPSVSPTAAPSSSPTTAPSFSPTAFPSSSPTTLAPTAPVDFGSCSPLLAPAGLYTFDALDSSGNKRYGRDNPHVLPYGWFHGSNPPYDNLVRVHSGSTSSSGTGPPSDHTTGTLSGNYLYAEQSGGTSSSQAEIHVCFDTSTLAPSERFLTFWIHSAGAPGYTSVYLDPRGTCTSYSVQLFYSRAVRNSWTMQRLDLPPTDDMSRACLRFVLARSSTFMSDTALDDISMGPPVIPPTIRAPTSSPTISLSPTTVAPTVRAPTRIPTSRSPTLVPTSTPSVCSPIFFSSALNTFDSLGVSASTYGLSSLASLPRGWVHQAYDPFLNSWRVGSGTTSSSGTGPSVDHTQGTTSGRYLYAEMSGGSAGATSSVWACYPSNDNSLVLSFYVHMYGSNVGSFRVERALDAPSCRSWQPIFTLEGSRGNEWLPYVVPLPFRSSDAGNVCVRFMAVRGNSLSGDIALDDVFVTQAEPSDPPGPTVSGAPSPPFRAMLAYASWGSSQSRLYGSTYENGAWSQGLELSNSAGNSRAVSVVLDANMAPYVVWLRDDPVDDLAYAVEIIDVTLDRVQRGNPLFRRAQEVQPLVSQPVVIRGVSGREEVGMFGTKSSTSLWWSSSPFFSASFGNSFNDQYITRPSSEAVLGLAAASYRDVVYGVFLSVSDDGPLGDYWVARCAHSEVQSSHGWDVSMLQNVAFSLHPSQLVVDDTGISFLYPAVDGLVSGAWPLDEPSSNALALRTARVRSSDVLEGESVYTGDGVIAIVFGVLFGLCVVCGIIGSCVARRLPTRSVRSTAIITYALGYLLLPLDMISLVVSFQNTEYSGVRSAAFFEGFMLLFGTFFLTLSFGICSPLSAAGRLVAGIVIILLGLVVLGAVRLVLFLRHLKSAEFGSGDPYISEHKGEVPMTATTHVVPVAPGMAGAQDLGQPYRPDMYVAQAPSAPPMPLMTGPPAPMYAPQPNVPANAYNNPYAPRPQ